MEKKLHLGKAFKEMRNRVGVTSTDLKGIMSRESLVKFEGDKNTLGLEKLNAALEFMGFTLTDLYYFAGIYHVVPVYGRTFQKLRRQRGYHRNFFINLGVSSIRLECFEEGKIMFPYHILDAMLLSIKIPEGDYSFALINEEDYFIKTVDKLDMAVRKRDFGYIHSVEEFAHQYAINEEEQIVDVDESEKNPADYSENDLDHYINQHLTREYADFRVLEITAQASYRGLTDSEMTELGDFLMGIDLWLEYSLGILALNSWQLPYLIVYDILHEIVIDKFYINKLIYRRRILQTAGRAAMSLAVQGDFIHARKLLEMVKPFNFTIDTHTQGMYRFAQAFVAFKEGILEGQREMIEVIKAFEIFGEIPSRDFAQHYYDTHVSL
ncbi:MAG: Rgg/GadR/MutR family transcriptional regulator [Lactococcus hircilactis]